MFDAGGPTWADLEDVPWEQFAETTWRDLGQREGSFETLGELEASAPTIGELEASAQLGEPDRSGESRP